MFIYTANVEILSSIHITTDRQLVFTVMTLPPRGFLARPLNMSVHEQLAVFFPSCYLASRIISVF